MYSMQTQRFFRLPAFIVLVMLAMNGFADVRLLIGQDIEANQSMTASVSWGSFRNGGRSEVLKASLPQKWSPESGIEWQVELPGYGQSSPVVAGDSVIITSVDGPQKEENKIVCISRGTGKTIWTVSQKSSLPGPSNYMFSRAAPSPMVDSKHVFAFFESGDLIAVELATGNVVWERNLEDEVGTLNSRHGLGSSPAQSQTHVFVNVEHDGPSSLLAIEKGTGKTAWKVERPSGSSWSSPIVFSSGKSEQVILSSLGNAVGLDAVSGSQLWNVEGLNGNTVSSPAVDCDRVFLGARKSEFGSVEKAAQSNLCLDFGDNTTSPNVAWRSARCISDYASPVVCGDHLYLINQRGILGCLDKSTGKELYRQRLGFECWATPVSDGTRLYVFGKNGTTAVIQAGDTFARVAENRLWDPNEPPNPVSYQEYFPPRDNASSHGAGHSGGGHGGKDSSESASNQKPGSSMLAGLLKADRDGDGSLSGDEIPKRLVSAMENIDLNQDGKLDKDELTKMAKMFAERRKNSQANSRDPIVYGVAADSRGFLVRTGTRLYSLVGDQ